MPASTPEPVASRRRRITIDAPDGATILAARHLDPTEGSTQVGAIVDAATRSAITCVLDYIAKASNASTAAPVTEGHTEAGPDGESLHLIGAHTPNAHRMHLPAARVNPVEHCGDPKPSVIGGERTECALRPKHQGSHADDRGCRWWPTVRTETGDDA